jgi:sugar phosphate isomerase/epimerase
MNFGFSANAFREYNLEETIEVLGNAGYDGVEILLDEPHLSPETVDEAEIKRIKRMLRDHDLEIANCNAFMFSAGEVSDRVRESEYSRDTEYFHHPSFVEHNAEDRKMRLEHTQAALRTAADLGASCISIPPGGPVPLNRPDDEAMDDFVESLRTAAETAKTVGVNILVEPEPELLIETTEEFLEFAERIDYPRIQCNFDAGHLFCIGEEPVEAFDQLIEYVDHVHLEDIPANRSHEHTQLGDGEMPISDFLEALDSRGYDGFVTIELYPYEETAAETAREAMSYLEDGGWV